MDDASACDMMDTYHIQSAWLQWLVTDAQPDILRNPKRLAWRWASSHDASDVNEVKFALTLVADKRAGHVLNMRSSRSSGGTEPCILCLSRPYYLAQATALDFGNIRRLLLDFFENEPKSSTTTANTQHSWVLSMLMGKHCRNGAYREKDQVV
ncbi:hypothetical protein MMC07_007101 [Pseudocyphellaria aurata]|nr:hypothetical protein [Pseudocyphellaria aurata]